MTRRALAGTAQRHFCCGLAGLLIAAGVSCSRSSNEHSSAGSSPSSIQIAYVAGPLAAPLHAAVRLNESPTNHSVAIKPIDFVTSGDAGYALLSGDADAALLEAGKAYSLIDAASNRAFKVAGAIRFPYGASLLVRKDLAWRLSDAGGKRIAVSGSRCKLRHQFEADLERLAPGTAKPSYVNMPFETMLPALEAREVDAVLTKGVYALIGQAEGHKVVYQNWEVGAGDECCPPIVAEMELLLVVAPQPDEVVEALVKKLEQGSAVEPAAMRGIISDTIRVPVEQLASYPVPEFVGVNDEIRASLRNYAWSPHR